VEVRGQRVAAHDRQRLRIPAETVLEEERQLGFAERNVLVACLKALDDIRQCAQAFVDVFGFFEEGTLKFAYKIEE